MKRLIIIAGILLAACHTLSAFAQDNGVVSPYSRYGFGLLSHHSTGFNSNMAGVGIGTQRGNELNPTNPASYAAIDSMSFIFDAGFSLQYIDMQGSTTKAGTGAFSLDYATLGFRAAKNLGVSIGLQPFSNVGYTSSSVKTIAESYDQETGLTATNTYAGSGGLREVYAGVGYAPVKEFSIGAQVGYVWGNINHSNTVIFSDNYTQASSRIYESFIRTYNFRAGMQGNIPLTKKDWITLGVTYGLGHKVNNKSLMISALTDSIEAKDAFELPHTFGAGLSWNHEDNIRIAADYEFQKWSKCKFPWLNVDNNGIETYTSTVGHLRDSHRIAVGMEYRPMKKGTRWQEYIRYRVGFALTTPYINTGGGNSSMVEGPTSYLVTAGVSLPILNMFSGRSTVNLALQYERIQPSLPGQLKENYFRLCLGIDFNEQWFLKWKVN